MGASAEEPEAAAEQGAPPPATFVASPAVPQFRPRAGTRGMDAVPTGPWREGRFGRLFRKLPVFAADEGFLRRLADEMIK